MVDLSFLGGLILGLASSLHCAGMCGGIASGLLLAFDPDRGPAQRAGVLLVSQAGRITAYVTAGGFLGVVGSEFYGAFNQAGVHHVMRWAAAVALGWIGLSMTGLVPALSFVDRLGVPFARLARRPARLAFAGGYAGPFIAGTAWGLLPCGMVYGALFYAMLTGSGGGGAMVMAGFGLGTLPAVTATALGVTALRHMAVAARLRVLAGATLVAIAAASALLPAAAWEGLCLT